MKYIIDNDMHLHSKLSECSNDPDQTTERILKYAEENGIKTLVITDHYWDSKFPTDFHFYLEQNFDHISKNKPLPKSDKVNFLFGCETDMDGNFNIGIPKERFDDFSFIIIPTTHLHMVGFNSTEEDRKSAKRLADLWVKRLDALLNMDLPFHKIGIAHLATTCIAPTVEMLKETLNLIPDIEMERLFKKAAALGVGIEINCYDVNFDIKDADVLLRPFRIAKAQGCKFYLASDAHHPDIFLIVKDVFQRAIDLLGLTEEDKFILKQ